MREEVIVRVSTDQSDSGYQLWLANSNLDVKVTLDGVCLKGICTMADDDLGIVDVARLNEKGELFVVGDEIAHEIKSGKVVISFQEKSS